eukprot:m51a1_g4179 hypothetical protein (479) ;mRNA; f:353201-361449
MSVRPESAEAEALLLPIVLRPLTSGSVVSFSNKSLQAIERNVALADTRVALRAIDDENTAVVEMLLSWEFWDDMFYYVYNGDPNAPFFSEFANAVNMEWFVLSGMLFYAPNGDHTRLLVALMVANIASVMVLFFWLGHRQEAPLPQPAVPRLDIPKQQCPPAPAPAPAAEAGEPHYDLVVVLTVWKRLNYEMHLDLITRQSVVREGMRTAVLVFHNGDHVKEDRVNASLDKWRRHPALVNSSSAVLYFHSSIETGYHGRFLGPFLVSTRSDTIWIVVDDDVIWGDLYFANMIRVVHEGSLAVRVGRFLKSDDWGEWLGWSSAPVGSHITWEEDTLCDFGGHLWAGKIEWLRWAWLSPPVTYATGEDFWISAVLRPYGVTTKVPRCPKPNATAGPKPFPDMCCCSHSSAMKHDEPAVGQDKPVMRRVDAMRMIKKAYNYRALVEDDPDIMEKWKSKMSFWRHSDLFRMDGIWQQCAYFY